MDRDVAHNIKIGNKEGTKHGGYVSEYAKDKAKEYKDSGELHRMNAEDFADSFKEYLDSSNEDFKEIYPNRSKIIKELLEML